MKIYKYPINIGRPFSLELPVNSEILAVFTQKNQPFMWVQFDECDEEFTITTKFNVLATGNNPDTDSGKVEHVSTFPMAVGIDQEFFIWHLYKIL